MQLQKVNCVLILSAAGGPSTYLCTYPFGYDPQIVLLSLQEQSTSVPGSTLMCRDDVWPS